MKTFNQLITDFNGARQEMKKLEDQKMRLTGITAVKVIKENFTPIQGFDSGSGITPWKARKASTNNAYEKRYGMKGSTYSSKNKILLQTRNLYNGIRYVIRGNNTVFIGVDLGKVPYASFVNETRQYLEYSPKMKNAIISEYQRRSEKIMEKFKK